MLIDIEKREMLNDLFQVIKLQGKNSFISIDNKVKIEQILAFLEIAHAEIRKISRKRKLVLVDSAAGNCYLSFLIYYYYQKMDYRDIEIHCIDHNKRLMDNNRELANHLNFKEMYFYNSDINEFELDRNADIVYSLHACDTATDKTMYLGIRNNARVILSVSCCQNTISIKNKTLKSVIRHKSFREKTTMMIADSLRALLLEKEGFKVDIFDFVSSRYTDKNTMVRAVKKGSKERNNLIEEYKFVSNEFKLKPHLHDLLNIEI